MKSLSDGNIIELIKKNSQQAFKILIERYEKKVANTVINMLGKCDEADDVGQEVFIRFYNNINQFKGNSSLGTYLTRIAINLSLNELKRRQIKNMRYLFIGKSERDDEKYFEIADNTNYENNRENTDFINKCLLKLEPKIRSVIVLRLIEGYDTRETAEILEIPQGTVLSRLSRGQEKLKDILLKSGYKP